LNLSYAYNDRLVLFSDIEEKKTPYAMNAYQCWETARFAALENNTFNEAI